MVVRGSSFPTGQARPMRPLRMCYMLRWPRPSEIYTMLRWLHRIDKLDRCGSRHVILVSPTSHARSVSVRDLFGQSESRPVSKPNASPIALARSGAMQPHGVLQLAPAPRASCEQHTQPLGARPNFSHTLRKRKELECRRECDMPRWSRVNPFAHTYNTYRACGGPSLDLKTGRRKRLGRLWLRLTSLTGREGCLKGLVSCG